MRCFRFPSNEVEKELLVNAFPNQIHIVNITDDVGVRVRHELPTPVLNHFLSCFSHSPF